MYRIGWKAVVVEVGEFEDVASPVTEEAHFDIRVLEAMRMGGTMSLNVRRCGPNLAASS